jgi:hypothetical protein
MKSKRAPVLLPEGLVGEIDALVGPRGCSSFLVETARQEVRRQKLLHFLETKDPAWKSQDHPELAGDATAWVHKLRSPSEARGAFRHKPKKRAGSQGPTRRPH